jgi:hypothetical protein
MSHEVAILPEGIAQACFCLSRSLASRPQQLGLTEVREEPP